MARKAEEGYRAAARLASPSRRRGKVAALTVGVIVVAWVAATLTGPPPPRSAVRETSPPAAVADTNASVPPTYPPWIEVSAGAPTALVPFHLATAPDLFFGIGGDNAIAWLDPVGATSKSESDPAWWQWMFLDADGTTRCICVEPGAGVGSTQPVHFMRFDADGSEIGDIVSRDWPLMSTVNLESYSDAALVQGTDDALLAGAFAGPDGWTVRLDRFTNGTYSAGWDVGTVPADKLSGFSPTELRLWVAPDGSRARIRLATSQPALAPAPEPPRTWVWLVQLQGDDAGTAVDVSPATGDDLAACGAGAWASPTEFVSLCGASGSSDASSALGIAIEHVDGSIRRLDLPGTVENAADWIVDGGNSLVYVYSRPTSHLYRISLPDLELRDRALPTPPTGDDVAPEPGERAPPLEHVAWQAGLSPRQQWRSLIVGSPDGTTLYVAGLSPEDGSNEAGSQSTGIWVLDATSLAVVDHWESAIAYEGLALTPDGAFLMGIGRPPMTEAAIFGNHGPTLAFRSVASGAQVLVLRAVIQQLGTDMFFLLPGPAS